MKNFAVTYRHKIVESNDVIQFFSNEFGYNLAPFFQQYLQETTVPVLELKICSKKIKYRFTNTVSHFQLPIHLLIDEVKTPLLPSNNWQSIKIKENSTVKFPENLFYIDFKRVQKK